MKRVLTIALLLSAVLAVGAQEWTATRFEADELKGTRAYTAYQYEHKGLGSYVSWGWDDPKFRLITTKGIFEESTCYAWFGSYRAVRVLVGIYDNNGTLKERFFVDMYKESQSLGDRISLSSKKSERKKAKKIAKALTTDRGYVRFVCARYSDSDFDLSVPFYNGAK